jgi:hypothetical protein
MQAEVIAAAERHPVIVSWNVSHAGSAALVGPPLGGLAPIGSHPLLGAMLPRVSLGWGIGGGIPLVTPGGLGVP